HSKVKLLEAPVRVGLSDENDYPHRGTVNFVGNQFDPNTGALPVRAVLPNADHFLLPGLSVRVRLAVSEPHEALLIPDGALGEILGHRDGRGPVFVISNRNTVEARTVKVGTAKDGWHVVVEGLTAEDR